MRRDLAALERQVFDVAVVGGGVFGCCIAWEAASRGLSVALIERGDFAEATSAHSFRMVHGGIRYLQHADLPRIRESVRERRALLRIAPHLVHPLPIVIPTKGRGMSGKAALLAGMRLYEALALDRNRGINDPTRRIPAGRILSRSECLRLFPALEGSDLDGAGVFYDGQMYNPPRLALAFVQSAVEAGAVAANYVEATQLLRQGNSVSGVEAVDHLTGQTCRIQARIVANAAGPWAAHVLGRAQQMRLRPEAVFSRDACFILRRPPIGDHALALLGKVRDPDAIVGRAARHLFLVPWRHYTLVGVWHRVWTGDPDSVTVTEAEIQRWLDEVNHSCPALDLGLDEVTCYNAGLVLFGGRSKDPDTLDFGKRSRIVDHGAADGVQGIITAIGVRWTTARSAAEEVVDLSAKKLGRRAQPSRTETTPVYGGRVGDMTRFLDALLAARPAGLPLDVLRSLGRNHGSEYARILTHVQQDPLLGERIAASHVIKAEVVHAVREEMAQHLGDVVLRRTDLGTGELPPPAALRSCAELMAAELSWHPARVQEEVERVRSAFPVPRARPAAAWPPAEVPRAAESET